MSFLRILIKSYNTVTTTTNLNVNALTTTGDATVGGYVGIGKTSPYYPLEIGVVGPNIASVADIRIVSRGVSSTGVWTDPASQPSYDFSAIGNSQGISAKFLGGLWIAGAASNSNFGKNGVFYSSDERIKTDITLISDDLALQKVNSLESKEYNYKGSIFKSEYKTIGFIAQDVLKVIPEAVSFHKNIIPDELRKIDNPQWNDNILTIPDIVMSSVNLTGKSKFYVSNDLSGNDEICIEIECEKDISGNNTNRFKFEQQYNNIFLYGKEVNDFHIIDKNLIFALHHSAIQELSRKIDKKDQQIQELEEKYSTLESDMVIIKNKIGL